MKTKTLYLVRIPNRSPDALERGKPFLFQTRESLKAARALWPRMNGKRIFKSI